MPPGHPEGWIEAFAQIYADAAELIWARRDGRAPESTARLLPTAEDGVDGMRFVAASVRSHQDGGVWVRLDDI